MQDYIKIADAYFGPDDLAVLLLIKDANPSCRVEILTSKKHQTQAHVPSPWEEAYQTHWRVRISDQAAPPTDIVIVGTESSGDSPVHDRWWITKNGGLRLGTSFNSLGVGKISDISVLTEATAKEREQEIDQFLRSTTREFNGERLQFVLFNLL